MIPLPFDLPTRVCDVMPWRLCEVVTRWQTIDLPTENNSGGIEGELFHFLRALVGLLKPCTILDIGTGSGTSALAFLLGCRDNLFGFVHSLEIDGQVAEDARAFLRKHRMYDGIKIHHADSQEWHWEFGPIDLLFVDGGADDRVRDVLRFSRHLSARGIVVAHDAADPQYGYAALHERFDQVLLPTPSGVLLLQPKRLLDGVNS